jgi:hypothetical protein
MVERMEDQQRETDWPGWHDIRPAVVDRPMARRPTQRAPSTLGWYHVRWIAINIALIAVTAWLYIHFLIPRILGNPNGGQQDVAVVDVKPSSGTTATPTTDLAAESVRRLRREPQLTAVEADSMRRAGTAMASGEFRCIGGKSFIVHRDANGSRIEQLPESVCHFESPNDP